MPKTSYQQPLLLVHLSLLSWLPLTFRPQLKKSSAKHNHSNTLFLSSVSYNLSVCVCVCVRVQLPW